MHLKISSHLLPHRHKDGERSGSSSPRSPRSPRTPRTPGTPNYSKVERNPQGLTQCKGCDNVDLMIRRDVEDSKNGTRRLPSVTLHNSFQELDECAHRCDYCRLFRQALILEEVTFDGIRKLKQTPGEVIVRWQQTEGTEHGPRFSLRVELDGHPDHSGSVNCNSQNSVNHLALLPNGLDTAVIEQAKGWLNTCLKGHIGQCDNLKWSSESPKLLIEILSADEICLREDQKGDYVALSYCWGSVDDMEEPQKTEVLKGRTVKENLAGRKKPFRISELPTTVRDALHIIRAMGIRYAWVDTLCIVQDDAKDVGKMHIIYSNALLTLCSCATTQATAKLIDQREAWSMRTEPCRLGGQWLTTPDMSLNELRLRSPLADRAWTLQEERLSPRMLYVSSNRMHWSCAKSHEMEMKPTYGKGHSASALARPVYAASDRDTSMPIAQEFLLACYAGTSDLHGFWLDTVKSYALRSMTHLSDRLTALSGLAAKYLSASRDDEYLAGLWSNHLAEGLAWRVNQATAKKPCDWPSWSWAIVPLETAIETDAKSARSSHFSRVPDSDDYVANSAEDAIKRGQNVKKLLVTGRTRPLWTSSSLPVEWKSVSTIVDREEVYTFSHNPEQNVHAVHLDTGRVLVYQDRKKEVIGQLDFKKDAARVQSDDMCLKALELGVSTMLILERVSQGEYRRIGVAWNVRQNFFEASQLETLILR